MQLDLGSAKTIIRGKTISCFYKKYPKLKEKHDSANLCKMQRGAFPHIRNLNIFIGDKYNCKVNAVCFEGSGCEIPEESIDTKKEILIGSIGADVLKNKIFIIDYPNSKFCISDKSNIQMSAYDFIPFDYLEDNEDYRLLLPFVINNHKVRVLFDTGASMFELSTIERNAKLICDHTIIDSIVVNSWGEQELNIGLKNNVELRLGNKTLPQITVYYDPNNKYDYFYESNNIFGLTGNALFVNDVVLIDYVNKKFGIKINKSTN